MLMKKLVILFIFLHIGFVTIAQPSSATHSYIDEPKQIIRVDNDFKFVTLNIKAPISDSAFILGYDAIGNLKFRKLINIPSETIFLNEAFKTQDNCLVGVGQYQQFCDTAKGNGFIYKIDTNGVFQFLYAGAPEAISLYNKYTSITFMTDSNAYYAFGKYVYDKFDVNGGLMAQNVTTKYKEVFTCLNFRNDVIVSYNAGTNTYRGYVSYFSDTTAFNNPDPGFLLPMSKFPKIKKMQFNSQQKIIALGEIFTGNIEGRIYMYDTLLNGFLWNLPGVGKVKDFDLKQDTIYTCLNAIQIHKVAPDSSISYSTNFYYGNDRLTTGICVGQRSITVVGKQYHSYHTSWQQNNDNGNYLTNYEIANSGLGREFSNLKYVSAQIRDWSIAGHTTTVIQTSADTSYIQFSYNLNVKIKNASPTWDGDDTIKSVYVNHQPIFKNTTSCGKPIYYKHLITGLNILANQEQYIVTPVVSDVYKKVGYSAIDTISSNYCVWSSAPNYEIRWRIDGGDYSCKTFSLNIVSLPEYTVNENLFSVYPNPNNGLFHISANAKNILQNYTIKIMNVFGNVVYTNSMSIENVDVNLNNYSNGIYFLSVSDKEKQLFTKKLIKQ